MLSRRAFLRLAGLGGGALLGWPLGCKGVPEAVGGGPSVEPLPDDPSKPWWHRFTIDTSAGKVSLGQLDDQMLEFPRINPKRQGVSQRYGYGASGAGKAGPDGAIPPFDRIVRLDRQTGTRQVHQLAPGQEADEPMFVPDPMGTSEDDGWLLTYVFDRADNRSHLRVIDAQNPTAKPLAQVKLPHRVPHGFHGDFMPG